jgi:hypothetical protein
MHKQISHPCDTLLQQWSIRRELVHYYCTRLLRLAPDDPYAEERRQEISEKLFLAQIALKQVADQLQSCQKEHNIQ